MSLVLCCRDAMGLLTEESEGSLAGATRASMSFHMTLCTRCRSYRKQLETTVDVLKAIPREETKADAIDAILAAIAKGEPGD